MNMRLSDGSFIMHEGGECDIRLVTLQMLLHSLMKHDLFSDRLCNRKAFVCIFPPKINRKLLTSVAGFCVFSEKHMVTINNLTSNLCHSQVILSFVCYFTFKILILQLFVIIWFAQNVAIDWKDLFV